MPRPAEATVPAADPIESVPVTPAPLEQREPEIPAPSIEAPASAERPVIAPLGSDAPKPPITLARPTPPPPAMPLPPGVPVVKLPRTVPPFQPPSAAAGVPHLQPKGNAPEQKIAPISRSTPDAVYNADKWLAGIAFVVVLGGIFYGFTHFKKTRQQKAEQAAAVAPAEPAAPASTAGKLIAKAREAANSHDQAAGALDTVVDPAPAAVAPPAPATPPPPPPPSDAFRAFVVHLRVSGVFQGEPARALLNGKMCRVGDIVDPGMEIKLVRIEPATKQLVFQDMTGATMPRRY